MILIIVVIAFLTAIIHIVRNSFVEWSYNWNEEAMEITCNSGRKRKFYRKNGSWFDDEFNLVGACSQQGLHGWLQAKFMEIEHQAKYGKKRRPVNPGSIPGRRTIDRKREGRSSAGQCAACPGPGEGEKAAACRAKTAPVGEKAGGGT